jgi:hypothetical protein
MSEVIHYQPVQGAGMDADMNAGSYPLNKTEIAAQLTGRPSVLLPSRAANRRPGGLALTCCLISLLSGVYRTNTDNSAPISRIISSFVPGNSI